MQAGMKNAALTGRLLRPGASAMSRVRHERDERTGTEAEPDVGSEVRARRRSSVLLLAGLAVLVTAPVVHATEPGRESISPPSLPEAPGYAHVVIAPPGRLVSVSGQVAIDSAGNVVGVGDFAVQCAQVFENLGRALRAAGLTFADVVRTDMFVTDLDHLPELRECRSRYLPTEDPPTSTLVQVAALIRPELMLEVAVTAVLPDARRD